jgi:hypothetical protein
VPFFFLIIHTPTYRNMAQPIAKKLLVVGGSGFLGKLEELLNKIYLPWARSRTHRVYVLFFQHFDT